MPETPPHPPAPPPSHRQGGGSLGASLSRKLGPLPLYAWVVVVVAGYFLWRHFHSSGGGALGNTAANTAGLGASTYVPTGDQSGGGSGEAGSSGVGDQTAVVPVGGGGTAEPTDASATSGGGASGAAGGDTATFAPPSAATGSPYASALTPGQPTPAEGGPLSAGRTPGGARAAVASYNRQATVQHHRQRQHHERQHHIHEKPKRKRKG